MKIESIMITIIRVSIANKSYHSLFSNTYGCYSFEYVVGIHADIRWGLNCTEDKNFCGKTLLEMH